MLSYILHPNPILLDSISHLMGYYFNHQARLDIFQTPDLNLDSHFNYHSFR